MTRTLVAAAVVALAFGLASCDAHATAPEEDPTTAPTTAPSYHCTPEAGGDPVPCTVEEYTRLEKLNVVYGEANDAYLRFFAENAQLMRAGGATEATAVMTETTGGPYLAAQVANLTQMSSKGIKAVGGDIKLVRIGRSPGASAYGYEVALDVCIDSRSVELVRGNSTVGQGYAYAERVFFRRDGEVLKAWDAEGKQVPAC